jgi:hypothetical protein
LQSGVEIGEAQAMGESRSEVLAESKRRAFAAGATTVVAVTLGVCHFPFVAAAAAVPAAILGYRWWKHRASSGIRF